MKKSSKKKPKLECKYCGKKFICINNHRCEKKRRYLQKSERYVQIGHAAWIMFMEHAVVGKQYDYIAFVNSRLYSSFINYGEYILKIKALKVREYTRYLINNSIPLKQWTKDDVYLKYIQHTLIKESPFDAVARGIVLAEKWADNENRNFTDFFNQVNTNQAVQWIKTGKISPWFMLSSTTANALLDRLNPEQRNIIYKYMDIGKWKIRIKRFKKEFNDIREVLGGVQL